MTYWCENCKMGIDEDEAIGEEGYEVIDGFRFHNPYEDIIKCPHCGEELSAEADRCPICGEWKFEDDYICHDCVDEIARYVKDMLKDYAFAHDMCESEAKEYFNLWLDQKGEI